MDELWRGWNETPAASKSKKKKRWKKKSGSRSRSRTPPSVSAVAPQGAAGASSSTAVEISIPRPDRWSGGVETRAVAAPFELPPPIDAPRPRKSFEIIVKMRVQKFRDEVFSKARKANPRDKEYVYEPTPTYVIDWSNPMLDVQLGSATFLVHRRDGRETYQNGDEPTGSGSKRRELELCHATRPDYLASIMLDGLNTIGHSHQTVGAWFLRRDMIDDEKAHDWGRTPLDFFSGCFLTVVARNDHNYDDLRTSRNVLGGGGERVVVKGAEYSSRIPIRITKVTLRMPSLQLDTWRDALKICIQDCVNHHGKNHLPAGTVKNAKKQLLMLVIHRLCYDRRYSSMTGKYERVTRIAYLMHIEIFEALRPLSHETAEWKKRRSWGQRTWQHLPQPFQEWFQRFHPEAVQLFDQDPTFDTEKLYHVRGNQEKERHLEADEEIPANRMSAVVCSSEYELE